MLLERLSESTSWVYLLSTKNLVSEIPDHAQFIKRHGYLLDLVISGFEEDMMLGIPILDQMPFTGLEKVPKYEDIASALHLKRSDIEANWETRSGVKGLLAKFLIKKVREFLKGMSFQAFEDILALLIYGLVLFPNSDQFIDVNTIKIFLTRNPMPTCLETFYILSTLVLSKDKEL